MAGETGQTGIKNVAVLVRLRHVHIRTADAAGLDLHDHFLRTRRRDVVFADLEARMTPHLAAEIGLAPFDILRSEFETGLGVPICDQSNTLHFPFHSFLLFSG